MSGEDAGATIELVEPAVRMGSYLAEVQPVEDAAGLIFLLWAMQQPTLARPNAFVRQSSMELRLDACGHQITIVQTPSSMASI